MGSRELQGRFLLIPEKADPERDAVARAWTEVGGEVLRIGRFWDPPAVMPESVRLYGGETFCLVLAQKLGLSLYSPPEELLLTLSPDQLKRVVELRLLSDLAKAGDYPLFVKPVVPKQFPAAVHHGPESVLAHTKGLPPSTLVLVSDVLPIEAEVRGFLLNGAVRAVGVYEGTADESEARAFLETVAAGLDVVTCALDIARTSDRGWTVVEANPTWASGLNGCGAREVLGCIDAATTLTK